MNRFLTQELHFPALSSLHFLSVQYCAGNSAVGHAVCTGLMTWADACVIAGK